MRVGISGTDENKRIFQAQAGLGIAGSNTRPKVGSQARMCYNISCLGERKTGRFAFKYAVNSTQYFIVGKAPFMCADSRPAVRLDNDGKHMKGAFSMEHNQAIQMYRDGASYREIGQFLGIDPKNVSRFLRKHGVDLARRSKPSHPVNEAFFDAWTPEAAYVIGFFYADGAFEKHHCFRFYSTDPDLLKSIKNAMQLDRAIEGPYKRNYRLTVNSRKLRAKLMEIVGTRRRLGVMTYPGVPEAVERDFIRGFFDGDGHVGEKPKQGAPVVKFTSTSRRFIDSLAASLKRYGIEIGSVTIVKGKKSNHATRYDLEFRNWALLFKFADLLYGHDPSLYLARKRERFQKWQPTTA